MTLGGLTSELHVVVHDAVGVHRHPGRGGPPHPQGAQEGRLLRPHGLGDGLHSKLALQRGGALACHLDLQAASHQGV